MLIKLDYDKENRKVRKIKGFRGRINSYKGEGDIQRVPLSRFFVI